MKSVRESLIATSTQAHNLKKKEKKKVSPAEDSHPVFWASAEAKESATK